MSKEPSNSRQKRAWSTPTVEKLGVDETCTGTNTTVEINRLNQCTANEFQTKSRTFCTPT